MLSQKLPTIRELLRVQRKICCPNLRCATRVKIPTATKGPPKNLLRPGGIAKTIRVTLATKTTKTVPTTVHLKTTLELTGMDNSLRRPVSLYLCCTCSGLSQIHRRSEQA